MPSTSALSGQVLRSFFHRVPLRRQVYLGHQISYRTSSPRTFAPRNSITNRGLNTGAKTEPSSVFYHSDIQCSDRLKDRTCVITGGSSGIGYAIAERFLHEGAQKVVIIGRNEERLQAAMEKLQKSLDSNLRERGKSIGDSAKSQPENQVFLQDSCKTIEFSPRISALAGDVGLSKFWTSAPWKTTLVRFPQYQHPNDSEWN